MAEAFAQYASHAVMYRGAADLFAGCAGTSRRRPLDGSGAPTALAPADSFHLEDSMRLFCLLALLLVAVPAAAQDAGPAGAQGDAYADADARELVRLARARRDVVDTRITAYEVTAQERISIRLGVAGVERLLFRRETAARIDWTPDTVRIEVLGAREVQPISGAGVRHAMPSLPQAMPSLAFDPVDSEMLLRFDSTVVRHPLALGSEAFYRFSSGGATSIRLPDGRVVRLLELRIAARRADPQLINGSFWLDAETHAIVRAGFRLSGGFSSAGSRVSLLTPEVTGGLDYVAIDYGLWDMRWWLPRTIAARGVVNVAGMRVPLSYERRYDGYRVEGDTAVLAPAAGAVATVAADVRPCRPRGSVNIGITIDPTPPETAARDSAWNAAWERSAARVAQGDTAVDSTAAGAATSERAEPCERPFLVTRAEGVDLRSSAALPANIYDDGDGPVTDAELRELSGLLAHIPASPWSAGRPSLRLLTPELVRANRVEGLSLGAAAVLPLGPAALRGELRAGTTGELGARLSGAYATPALRTEVAAYRGLQAVDVAAQPFSLTGSVGTLLLGRDENDYFRGAGAELRLSPAPARPQPWDVRLFAERQQPVRARSELSLRALVDDGFEVRENLEAEPIDQLGATFRLRGTRGNDPARLRTRAELELHGEAGDRAFVRPTLRLGADRLLTRNVGLGLGLSAGSAFGETPVQRAFQVGGVGSVRGHEPAALRGESMWLARTELTWGSPGMRFSLFGDAGWAGERSALADGRPLQGVGVGATLLDNLLRLDLARGLGDDGGVRLYLRFGGGL
jgi:hypothetical protein